jgi:tagaturonate reductase
MVRILQFGEGNFLRAFVDWMAQKMAEKAGWKGAVTLAKTIPGPFAPEFGAQGMKYTVALRGISGGQRVSERDAVSVIDSCVNPYEDFDGYLEAAADPDIKVIVSNTTEAGIAPSPGDRAEDRPAPSYPGKLCQFLRARYLALGPGKASAILLLPCELIEKNGERLRECVLEHAGRWYSDPGFVSWLKDDCAFYDTLVDRIVPGHDPQARAELKRDSGFDDALLVATEPYHIWAIQGRAREDLLPFKAAGLNVVWTDDIRPLRTRKVWILNGGHTFMAMCGPGMGAATVRDCLEHPRLSEAIKLLFDKETIPGLPYPAAELSAYAAAIMERYANPYIEHKLSSISLNSVAKWKTRLLPLTEDFAAKRGKPPVLAAFSLGALVHRYMGDEGIVDDAWVLEGFAALREKAERDPRAAALEAVSSQKIWNGPAPVVPGLAEAAADAYASIRKNGFEAAFMGALDAARKE